MSERGEGVWGFYRRGVAWRGGQGFDQERRLTARRCSVLEEESGSEEEEDLTGGSHLSASNGGEPVPIWPLKVSGPQAASLAGPNGRPAAFF
jgi:hypothetical protein